MYKVLQLTMGIGRSKLGSALSCSNIRTHTLQSSEKVISCRKVSDCVTMTCRAHLC